MQGVGGLQDSPILRSLRFCPLLGVVGTPRKGRLGRGGGSDEFRSGRIELKVPMKVPRSGGRRIDAPGQGRASTPAEKRPGSNAESSAEPEQERERRVREGGCGEQGEIASSGGK